MSDYIYQGHLIHKQYGQNFLRDRFVIDSIVSAIKPKKSQAMVEIGPGLAALTEPVGENLDHLTVIELDYDLVSRLKMHPSLSHKLTIYQDDVMTVDFSDLSEKIGKPLRVFGNLPYNISSSLIFHLFKHIGVISDMHFMLQKEVVDRLLAKPNNKIFGRLSVMTQYHCQILPILEVSPRAFIPIPKVDSMLVRLVPHKILPYPAIDLRVLSYVTEKAFKQRRKKIRNSLSNFFTIDDLIKIGIDPDMRAENISIEEYCSMVNYIEQRSSMTEKRKKDKSVF